MIKKVLQIVKIFKVQKSKFKGRKPNKIWVDKISEFYNRSMKSQL